MAAGDLVSEGQWLINVSGIEGTFETKTGGEPSTEHTRNFDGGALTADVSQGKPSYSDLTVSRAFKNPRDVNVRKALAEILGAGRRFPATITATPLNEQQVAAGPAEIYTGYLQRVTPAEANSNSAQPSRLSLLFTIVSAR